MVFEVGHAVSHTPNDIDSADGGQSAPMRLSTTSPMATRSQTSHTAAVSAGAVYPSNSSAALGGNIANHPVWVWGSNNNNNSGPGNNSNLHFNNNMHTFDLEVGGLGDTDNAFWWDFEHM
jgi:hypothetical protein